MGDQALIKSLGLDMSLVAEDQGKTIVENFDRTLSLLSDDTTSDATKLALADAFSSLGVASEEMRAQLYEEKGEAFMQAVGEWIKAEGCGPQVAYKVLGSIGWHFTTNLPMAKKLAPCTIKALRGTASLDLASSKPMKEDGPAVYRANAIVNVASCMPYTGYPAESAPEDTVDIFCALIARKPIIQTLQSTYFGALNICATNAGSLFPGHMGPVFEAVRAYPIAASVLGSIKDGFKSDPNPYIENLDLLWTLDLNLVIMTFQQISTTQPLALIPHKANVMKVVENPIFGSMAFTWLKDMALKSPEVTVADVESLFENAFKTAGIDTTYAMLVGAVGRNDPKGGFALLMKVLKDPRLSNYAPPVVLNEVNNMKEQLPGGREDLAPYMDVIMKYEASSAALVASIEDFYEGRSLEILAVRVDAVEQKINELNAKVSESCQNFDEVKAYLDKNIEDLKDFVATIAKKLPTPTRFSVTGKLRKTLKLHFPCCRNRAGCTSIPGAEFVIESKDWSKWLKVGFSVIKLGKAAIDIGMGNPLGLVETGIDCVKEIYEIYKTNVDDDFNSYIREPFLTSTEQDKLVEALRAQGFFDVFEYDAQQGGWTCKPCTLPQSIVTTTTITTTLVPDISGEPIPATGTLSPPLKVPTPAYKPHAGGSTPPPYNNGAGADMSALVSRLDDMEKRLAAVENKPQPTCLCVIS